MDDQDSFRGPATTVLEYVTAMMCMHVDEPPERESVRKYTVEYCSESSSLYCMKTRA